jgi:hypothetical protein
MSKNFPDIRFAVMQPLCVILQDRPRMQPEVRAKLIGIALDAAVAFGMLQTTKIEYDMVLNKYLENVQKIRAELPVWPAPKK